MQKMRADADSPKVVDGIGKWLVRFVVLLVAFDALGLPAVPDVLRQFLLWLPNLVIALVILIFAGIAARALGNVLRGATSKAGFTNPETLANVAKTAVWAFAIIIAVDQVGIASTLVNTLFMGVVGALALACGLAFGLGGRELAAVYWRIGTDRRRPKSRRSGAPAEQRPTSSNESRRSIRMLAPQAALLVHRGQTACAVRRALTAITGWVSAEN